ncbi:Putative H/ACA ribonucleoprotein complex subunit 1-like protein 1 [Linum perenne]
MRPPRGGGGFRGGRDGGRGGGGFRGGRDGGRGFRGGRSGGRGFGGGFRDEGPPSEVVEISTFIHACEGDAVTKLTNEKIPYFNAPIFLKNMIQIGKVDEIFGPINESFFSIKMMEGIVASSYSPGDKFYIDPNKLLPLARFLSQPKYVFLSFHVSLSAFLSFPTVEIDLQQFMFKYILSSVNKWGMQVVQEEAVEEAGEVVEEVAVEEEALEEGVLHEVAGDPLEVDVVALGAEADSRVSQLLHGSSSLCVLASLLMIFLC